MVQNEVAETEPVVDEQEGQVTEHKCEKRSTKHEAVYSEDPVDKRPRLEESDLVLPFIVQPRIKNMSVGSDTSAIRDPAVALSLASSISLLADRATLGQRPIFWPSRCRSVGDIGT